ECFALGRTAFRTIRAGHRIAALGAPRALASDVVSLANALERPRVVTGSSRHASRFKFASACRATTLELACSACRAKTFESAGAGNFGPAPGLRSAGGPTSPARDSLQSSRGFAELP